MKYLLLVFVTACLLGVSRSDVLCVVEYDVTPAAEAGQDDYDIWTEYEKYDAGSTPVLGYSNYTINNPNYSEDELNPCITVDTDSTGYKIALLAQPTLLGDAFCVDSNIDGFAQQCNTNEFKWCNDGNTEVTFQFSCYQQSCEKSSIELYVKLLISDSDDSGEIEYWCDSTNDTYPSSLVRTQADTAPDYTGNDPSQTKTELDLNTGLGLKISAVLSILMPLFVAMLF